MLSTVGRGGNAQAVRDEILNIMHRNKIPELKGTWMEEWHQKLHVSVCGRGVGARQRLHVSVGGRGPHSVLGWDGMGWDARWGVWGWGG